MKVVLVAALGLGSDGGMNLLLYFTSPLRHSSTSSVVCSCVFTSFTDLQYVGTQVQVNETE